MCEKCVELDRKIQHYERIRSVIMDQQTVHAIKKLIEQIHAQKASLHPEDPP